MDALMPVRPGGASRCAPSWSVGRGIVHRYTPPDGRRQSPGRYNGRPVATLRTAMAFDPRLIDDIARRLAGAVPENVAALGRDLEQNFKGVLQSQLAKLDLVTREEFDVQSAVLRRTRERLAVLEKRLSALEEPPAPAADG